MMAFFKKMCGCQFFFPCFLSWTHLPNDDFVTTESSRDSFRFSKADDDMTAGEEDTAAGDNNKGGEQQQQQQQLSISLETKMPPDVVAAVLATKSSSSLAEGEAHEIRKIESSTVRRVNTEIESAEIETEEIAKEEEEERSAVDESLTISMLVDEDRESEKSPREDEDDTKAVAAKSRPTSTFATKVREDDEKARIDDWIATVKRQNCRRVSSAVYYDETMPGLDDLLAAREGWSQEFLEEALTKKTKDGSGDDGDVGTTIDPELDLTFEEYAEVICALLGVPIYKGKDGKTSNRSLIQSLHLAMSLYIEVDEEQHTAEHDDDIF